MLLLDGRGLGLCVRRNCLLKPGSFANCSQLQREPTTQGGNANTTSAQSRPLSASVQSAHHAHPTPSILQVAPRITLCGCGAASSGLNTAPKQTYAHPTTHTTDLAPCQQTPPRMPTAFPATAHALIAAQIARRRQAQACQAARHRTAARLLPR